MSGKFEIDQMRRECEFDVVVFLLIKFKVLERLNSRQDYAVKRRSLRGCNSLLLAVSKLAVLYHLSEGQGEVE